MKLNKSTLFFFLGLSLIVSSCGGGSGNGSSPPPVVQTNSPPRVTSETSFSVNENQQVRFQLSATDSDGDSIRYSLPSTGDGRFFTIDSSSGVLSANPNGMSFDFETPQDSNQDNIYIFDVTVSDGKVSITTAIEVSVINEIEPATCSTGETVSFEENTIGLIYKFEVSNPEGSSSDLVFQNLEVRREGGYGYSNEFFNSISLNGSTGELELATPIDAEREGTEYAFDIAAIAKFGEEFLNCSVTLSLIDIPGQVTSGIKVVHQQETSTAIGDIDGDGRSDLWIETPQLETGEPDQPGGFILYGSTVDMELIGDNAGVLDLASLTSSQALHIHANFPVVGDSDTDGTRLISSQIDDVSGNGIPELLLGLRPKLGSSDEAVHTTRPLAYLLWGDALAGQSAGKIDLNNLSTTDGIVINGLSDIQRTGLSVGSGDFDGDGIADVTIGVPLMLDSRDTNDFQQGYVYIVYGKTLQEVATTGQFNLAEMTPSQGIVIHDLDWLPWIYMGYDVSSLGDIDNDGADELVIVSARGRIGIMHSSLFLNNASGKISIKEIEMSDEFLSILHHTKTTGNTISAKKGDVDGDGLYDLLISGNDQQFGLGALFPAAHILASDYNTLNGLFLNPYQDEKHPYVTFVNSDLYPYRNKSGSFIGDLDGDGLDDFALWYIYHRN